METTGSTGHIHRVPVHDPGDLWQTAGRAEHEEVDELVQKSREVLLSVGTVHDRTLRSLVPLALGSQFQSEELGGICIQSQRHTFGSRDTN